MHIEYGTRRYSDSLTNFNRNLLWSLHPWFFYFEWPCRCWCELLSSSSMFLWLIGCSNGSSREPPPCPPGGLLCRAFSTGAAAAQHNQRVVVWVRGQTNHHDTALLFVGWPAINVWSICGWHSSPAMIFCWVPYTHTRTNREQKQTHTQIITIHARWKWVVRRRGIYIRKFNVTAFVVLLLLLHDAAVPCFNLIIFS